MRRLTAVLALVCGLLVVGDAVPTSGAVFTASSAAGPATIRTAARFEELTASLSPVPSWVAGTVDLVATATGVVGPGTVEVAADVGGAGTWGVLCAGAGTPHTCAWDTTALDDGEAVWLQAQASDASSSATSAAQLVHVDNAPPAVEVTLPGNGRQPPGPVPVLVRATDDDSGVATVAVEVSIDRGPWIPVCTLPGAQATCELVLGAGSWRVEARASAVDVAGSVGTSDVATARLVLR